MILSAFLQASLVAQTVKRLPAMWKTRVQSLGWEDPLEKEMPAHSSILAWKIPWTEDLVGYSPWAGKESDIIIVWSLCTFIEPKIKKSF